LSTFFNRLKKGLSRSREELTQMLPGGEIKDLSVDEWMDIEDGLIMADCGAETAASLIARARKSRTPLGTLRAIHSVPLRWINWPCGWNAPEPTWCVRVMVRIRQRWLLILYNTV